MGLRCGCRVNSRVDALSASDIVSLPGRSTKQEATQYKSAMPLECKQVTRDRFAAGEVTRTDVAQAESSLAAWGHGLYEPVARRCDTANADSTDGSFRPRAHLFASRSEVYRASEIPAQMASFCGSLIWRSMAKTRAGSAQA
jgi:hypothetical protein